MPTIKKAVITAGGFGSRFLPATKSIPKELLPIINKPAIHYIVDQCIDAGITDIIIVSKPGNESIQDYFSHNAELEEYLTIKGKTKELQVVREIYRSANVTIVMQDESLPYGNARPLYTIKDLIGDEPFIYSYGDDIVFGEGAGVKELVAEYEASQADIVLMCTEVSDSMVPKVGIVKIKEGTKNQVEHIVEKPKLENAPSKLASVACYVFSPVIFDHLDPTYMGDVGEFFLQKGIDEIIETGTVTAVTTTGKWLTNGDPLNYLISTVEVALDRQDLKEDFKKYLLAKVASL
jgi:UTP--glucose-1-phosphate uridylyltransferase